MVTSCYTAHTHTCTQLLIGQYHATTGKNSFPSPTDNWLLPWSMWLYHNNTFKMLFPQKTLGAVTVLPEQPSVLQVSSWDLCMVHFITSLGSTLAFVKPPELFFKTSFGFGKMFLSFVKYFHLLFNHLVSEGVLARSPYLSNYEEACSVQAIESLIWKIVLPCF